ncbi:RNA methyltransferase [Acidianus sulfidivorans JP7]|uniref:RNA methyltransferase n=1 Tax=Acidianus sulfidivorans JP7 TaxID=619593 RepID=A0A2U9IML7_9CREN|nr:tRNA (cytidine-2'-O-)-methyltransferase TrmJ [Acidianus sulfidivorans]AWR97262.1 RNA methyltransferase [Acidianus sulfidivorans JP7]
MLRVILVEPEGEYNVGFVARLCKNFCVDELYIVNPKCDLKESLKFSAKGSSILENSVIVSNFDDAIKDLGIKIATSSIADYEGDILRKSIKSWEISDIIAKNDKIGLIFGRESVGLTREEISKSDFLLYIPANPAYPVLNLSHAVAIVLYEIWKSKGKIKKKQVSYNELKLIDRYTNILYHLVKKNNADYSLYLALKRALFKGVEDDEEAKIIISFLRKLYNKIIHEDKE